MTPGVTGETVDGMSGSDRSVRLLACLSGRSRRIASSPYRPWTMYSATVRTALPPLIAREKGSVVPR